MFFSIEIIRAGWLCTICTICADSIYLATHNSTSSHCVNLSCISWYLRPSAIVFRSMPINTQFSTDTRSTLSCCSVFDIVMNQPPLSELITYIHFRTDRCSGYYNNQQNSQGLRCCCCCCCRSLCQKGSDENLFLAIGRQVAIGMEPGINTEVPSSVLPEHCIVNIPMTIFSGCMCRIWISSRRDSWLFAKVSLRMMFYEQCSKDCLDTVISIRWFRRTHQAGSATRVKPIGSRSTAIVELLHLSMVINVDSLYVKSGKLQLDVDMIDGNMYPMAVRCSKYLTGIRGRVRTRLTPSRGV